MFCKKLVFSFAKQPRCNFSNGRPDSTGKMSGTSIESAVRLCVAAREWVTSSSWLFFALLALCYTVRNIADSRTFTLIQRCRSFRDQMQCYIIVFETYCEPRTYIIACISD